MQRYDFGNQLEDHFKTERTSKTKNPFAFFTFKNLHFLRFGTCAGCCCSMVEMEHWRTVNFRRIGLYISANWDAKFHHQRPIKMQNTCYSNNSSKVLSSESLILRFWKLLLCFTYHLSFPETFFLHDSRKCNVGT